METRAWKTGDVSAERQTGIPTTPYRGNGGGFRARSGSGGGFAGGRNSGGRSSGRPGASRPGASRSGPARRGQ